MMKVSESSGFSNRRQSGSRLLEKMVLGHFIALLVFTTWAFGGQAAWARQVIAAWGLIGVLLFFAVCWSQAYRERSSPSFPALRFLWPLIVYDLVVGVSCFNPSFTENVFKGASSLVMTDPISWLPSAARPMLAMRELWQFNVIVLSCFSLATVLKQRRKVRMVLLLIGVNAVVLAVFGTFQQLVGSPGLWFGLVPSPNPQFFSTFIYHNHWGAFALLNAALCVGLFFHFLRHQAGRDIWHSPVPMGGVATLLLAATIPLSGSRSCTFLLCLLLGGALVHQLRRLIRQRREQQRSAILPTVAILGACVLAVAAIGYLAREVIVQRSQLTADQVAQITKEETLNSRLTLYRDTWRMAVEKPWFGWGLESYAHVFRIFNTQRAVELWVWIPFYAEAHNDWLQSIAEVGFVGTALLGLLIGLPWWAVRWRAVTTVMPRYLLAGNALILLYGWVEFPFANPAVMLTFCALFYCAIRYALLDLRAPTEEAR